MPPCLRPSSDLVPGIQTVLSAPFSMAEWHSSTNEDLRASFPDPSVMPTPSTPQSDSWVNLPHRDEQRELFDQALVACWKELPQAQGRPKVPIISDGKTVDLYKLSNNVKKKGGYDWVSANKMWVLVAGDLGFGPECGPTLKLVYVKYLKQVDIWLQRLSNSTFNGASLNLQQEKRNGHRFLLSDPVQNTQTQHADSVYGTGLPESPIVILDSNEPSDDLQGTYNGKRKYDSFLGLLKWIKRVARNPCGSIIRQGVDFSSHSEEWVQECWIQAIRARAVLCLQNEDRLSGEVLYGQKKQKVHPSLYEESHTANHQPLDRLRATDRRLALYVSSASTSMDSQSIQYFPRSSNVGNSTSVSSLLYLERISRRRIPISPNNQAIVPSWNGPKKCAGSGDSISVEVDLNLDAFKWLGTKVWPPEGGQMMVNKDRIGKGRPGRCLCFFPGSIECVRLHIREERDKLKSELGSAFFSWRFDDMGEDASMLWTPEEERKFRALVRLNPVSLKRNFWHHLSACFPSKSMELLVCYYFNVFVLRRRTLQNRVKPEKIDSDDDESEFGSVENLNMDGLVLSGMRTGHLLPRGNYSGETSGTLICQQNMQYNDFDVFGGPFEGGRNGKDIQNEHGVQHLRYNVAERGLNQGGT
ncbi:AT-rich interactive domain-containing protein 2 [Cryptomeria japonica]|uniref:AT-rich interactive domain-containing protein 2 n=1 Tax=Cryptomeria japonica TaxID=3369 RepID=UPI0027DA4277|nr:AT-rich interactive domain-containing protein 2 [Cryptomeria japonica]XP_057838003.2 AT-rich interactive domain-containing protein 2 [Cryptomeria japonica]XP_057838004.2 AT-rich interactive domain-containing protein 2 [Cryptomeria japonica]